MFSRSFIMRTTSYLRKSLQLVENYFTLILIFILPGILFLINCDVTDDSGDDTQKTSTMISLQLTVADNIQTYDPWTSGSTTVNEWAKPIYRIWLDTNGNPEDGGYDNGQGPRAAEIWLDTGNIGFRWDGPDGEYNTNDDVQYWPLNRDSETQWSGQGISAYITNDRKTLSVSIPRNMMGNPSTLEVSFMTSPWTTSASDNLVQGANSRPCWIVVSDAETVGEHSQTDASGDNDWPNLTPDTRNNFDLVKGEVRIEGK